MMEDKTTCSYCGDRLRTPEVGSFGAYCTTVCMIRDERRIQVGITLMLAILLLAPLGCLLYFEVISL